MRLNLDPERQVDAAILRFRRLFGHLALFSAVINLLVLAPTIYMSQVYDRVLVSRNETTLLMLTLILLGLFVLSSLLEWVRGQIMVGVSSGMDAQLGEQVFSAAFRKSLREGGHNPAQSLSDLNTVRQFLTGPGFIALLDAPWTPIYLAACFIFHPLLGAFALTGSLIMVGLAVWNEWSTHQGLHKANQLAAQSSTTLNSTLQNAEVIQAMGMQEALRKRWAAVQQRMMEAQAEASDRGARISAITRFVRMTWQSLALALGAVLVLENQISSGVMIAVSVLVGRTMAPVEQAIGAWKQLNGARSSYERLCSLMDNSSAERERMELPAPTGAVRVEQLSVTPPGAKSPVLENVSFSLNKGEVLAVIGTSASGKSSLVRTLVGIWPASAGAVRFDEADISQWSNHALGPFIGYLPQDIELFDGTIAENIARFGEVSSEKVITAARMAGIHEMLVHLPQGYDTPLGTGGIKLSGGQKQRLGLARALYGQPPVIVLDEPNSNLDEAGEMALLQAINQLRTAGSTIIVVTHRPNIFAVVDKLLFLKDGTQKLFGPKDQVIRTLVPTGVPSTTGNSAGNNTSMAG